MAEQPTIEDIENACSSACIVNCFSAALCVLTIGLVVCIWCVERETPCCHLAPPLRRIFVETDVWDSMGYYPHYPVSPHHTLSVVRDSVPRFSVYAQCLRQQELSVRQDKIASLPSMSHAELCERRRSQALEIDGVGRWVHALDEEEGEECAICLCAYEAEDTTTVLPCAHHFHKDCVSAWFQSRLVTQRAFCPLCKGDVLAPSKTTQPTLSNDEQDMITVTTINNEEGSSHVGRVVLVPIPIDRRNEADPSRDIGSQSR
jgi:hypothetical protein